MELSSPAERQANVSAADRAEMSLQVFGGRVQGRDPSSGGLTGKSLKAACRRRPVSSAA